MIRRTISTLRAKIEDTINEWKGFVLGLTFWIAILWVLAMVIVLALSDVIVGVVFLGFGLLILAKRDRNGHRAK